MIIFLYEIMHKKRIAHYSYGKYFHKTPQKQLGCDVNKESGYYLEKSIFGSAIILKEITEEIAEEILNVENYKTDTNSGDIKIKKILSE